MRSAYPAVFLCALACASAPSSSAHLSTATAPIASKYTSSSTGGSTRGVLLTGSQPTEYFGGETLYDVLRLRAPLYLKPRGALSLEKSANVDPLAVYIDGTFAGTWEVLQLLPAYTIFSVERLSATEAALKFGSRNNASGALVVTSIRR